MTSEPRGSFTTADRNPSCRSRKTARRSAIEPLPRAGPPSITTRVGSPPVCVSITRIRCKVECDMLAAYELGPCRDPAAYDTQDSFSLLTFQHEPGGPDHLRAQAAFLHGELDVLDELHVGIEVQQRRVPAVNLDGLVPSSRCGQVPEQAVLGGERVDEPRYPACRAQEQAFQNQIINSAEKGVPISACVLDVGDAPDVLGRFLDRHQAWARRPARRTSPA